MEARIGYVENRREWLAVIVQHNKVVCVGCEMTEAAAESWARDALRFHRGVEGAEHPKDMYDRAKGSLMQH